MRETLRTAPTEFREIFGQMAAAKRSQAPAVHQVHQVGMRWLCIGSILIMFSVERSCKEDAPAQSNRVLSSKGSMLELVKSCSLWKGRAKEMLVMFCVGRGQQLVSAPQVHQLSSGQLYVLLQRGKAEIEAI